MCEMCTLVETGKLVKMTNTLVDSMRMEILKSIGIFNNAEPGVQSDVFLKAIMKRLILLMEWSDDSKKEIDKAIAIKETEKDQTDAELKACAGEEIRKLRETLGLS